MPWAPNRSSRPGHGIGTLGCVRVPTLTGVGAGILVSVAVLVVAILLLPPPVRAPGPASPVPVASAVPAGPSAATTPGATDAERTSGASAAPGGSAGGIGLPTGEQAPPLELPALDGSRIDLAALRGRPVWVDFIASWSPACQVELPLVEKYRAELGDRVAIVLVDVREAPATVSAFATQMKLDVPIGLDQAGAVQRAWAAYSLPIHYWIDTNGVIRASAYGGLGSTQMLDGLQQVLPGASTAP